MMKFSQPHQRRYFGIQALIFATLLVMGAMPLAAQAQATESPQSWIVALDADMSGQSAIAGQAIRRGALLAMDAINAEGGIHGIPLSLRVSDHRANPARAEYNIRQHVEDGQVIALLGGMHTPAAMAQVPIAHQHRLPFLIPWAAGTPIVDNGLEPNPVFRISLRDSEAGPFLVQSALRAGHRRLGMLLENTAWGRSNFKAMSEAAATLQLEQPLVEWFQWGEKDLGNEIERLHRNGATAILLVANTNEGLIAARAMAARPSTERLTLFSHWGISGGTFGQQAADILPSLDLQVLQTFSFARPPFPERAAALAAAYQRRFGEGDPATTLAAAPGVAHAYDLIQVLATAMRSMPVIERGALITALEEVGGHQGIMADYDPVFSPRRRDALSPAVYLLTAFDTNGTLQPVPPTTDLP